MTFPVVRASNSGTENGTSSTSHVLTMPATVIAGDLLLAFICTTNLTGLSTPTGWTNLATDANGTTDQGTLSWKLAVGTEGGTTVTWTTTNSVQVQWITLSVQGWDGLTAPVKGVAVNATTSTPNPPALTPAWGAADTFWIAVVYSNSNITYSVFPLTDNHITVTGNASFTSLAICTQGINTATEDPGTFTQSTSKATIAQTYAVRPLPFFTKPQIRNYIEHRIN